MGHPVLDRATLACSVTISGQTDLYMIFFQDVFQKLAVSYTVTVSNLYFIADLM